MKNKLIIYSDGNSRFIRICQSLFRQCRFLMFSGLLFITIGSVYSQQISISGTVRDAGTGEALPGANVIIRGTTQGTTTDIDGNYTINVPGENTMLVFSFIGYLEETRSVMGISVLNVDLMPSLHDLDEIVVIGYGVQRKALTTGATSQVRGDDLVRRNTSMALQALQGQTSGVQITPTSGQPGAGLRVVVRGLGTIGNPHPLYVVDGIQTGDITHLNMADIESIDILKDAASAAIYGAQAANGVVLITTKSGSDRPAEITFDSYYGLMDVERRVDLLDSRQYAVIMNEAAINSGKNPYFTNEQIAAMGRGSDWMDHMIYDGAATQNYSLGISGGTETSIYSLSMSYTGEDGIIGGPDVSHYNRYNFRLNTEHKLREYISVGQNLTYTYSEQNGIDVGNQYANNLRPAFEVSPFLPMYDDEGNYLNNHPTGNVIYNDQPWVPWNPDEANPYAQMMLTNQSRNNNQKLFGNLFMEITPLAGLSFRSVFGVDYTVNEGRSYQPVYELSMYSWRTNDLASQNLNKGIALTWDNVLTYNMNFNDHSMTAMAGTSAYSTNGSWISTSNTDLIISDLDHAWVDNATNTDLGRIYFGAGPWDESRLLSYFGRINYDFREKYLFNATFRADGSSRFAEGNRWGYFPSVSAGWVVSNEPFMESTNSWLNFLKPRASWGQVGNQRVTPWQYLAPVSVNNANYYFGSQDYDAAGNAVGAFPSRLSNANLKWETSEQTNIGVDAYLFNYRLGLNFDWYNKTTKDWIVQAPVLAIAGANAPFINGGDVSNTGIELAVSWRDRINQFGYFINGNISYNENTVNSVPTIDGIIHGQDNSLYHNSPTFYRRAQDGYPIGYFWGWETDGIFQNEQEVLDHTNDGRIIQPNAKPGDLRYVDHNGDGRINEADKVMIGNPNPDYIFGFTVGFDFRGIDLSVSGHGVAGNQIVQSYRNYSRALPNYTTEILGRWHGEGTSTTIPRVTETNINYLPSDIFIKDGDFLRINNITLGYDLSQIIDQRFVSQARIYISVVNALTFTKYNGMDPEIGYGLQDGSSGTDLGFYPRPRTSLIGLNIKF